MTKFNLHESLKEIKRWLEPQYHHLLDQNVYNLSTKFIYKNSLKFKTPYDCIKYLCKYYKEVNYYNSLLTIILIRNYSFHKIDTLHILKNVLHFQMSYQIPK